MRILEALVVDATHLELSEPIALQQGKRVVVSVAQLGDRDADRDGWLSASAASLEAAYGDEDPDYATSRVREVNSEYSP
jgi:hypothetical protein